MQCCNYPFKGDLESSPVQVTKEASAVACLSATGVSGLALQ